MNIVTILLRMGIHLFLLLMIFAAAPTFVRASDCPPQEYDTATKKAVTAFLKAKYGDDYIDFDVDAPSLVSLSDADKSKNYRKNVYSLGFYTRDYRKTIVIDFDHCTNKILGSFELHSSNANQKPTKLSHGK